jgi:hypothetical protein
MNDVAQQQMSGDIQTQQAAQLASHQSEMDAKQEAKTQKEEKSPGTFVKLKQIL